MARLSPIMELMTPAVAATPIVNADNQSSDDSECRRSSNEIEMATLFPLRRLFKCDSTNLAIGVSVHVVDLYKIIGGHSRIRTYDFHRVKVFGNRPVDDSKTLISRLSVQKPVFWAIFGTKLAPKF
jgi:hypothetical protein